MYYFWVLNQLKRQVYKKFITTPYLQELEYTMFLLMKLNVFDIWNKLN